MIKFEALKFGDVVYRTSTRYQPGRGVEIINHKYRVEQIDTLMHRVRLKRIDGRADERWVRNLNSFRRTPKAPKGRPTRSPIPEVAEAIATVPPRVSGPMLGQESAARKRLLEVMLPNLLSCVSTVQERVNSDLPSTDAREALLSAAAKVSELMAIIDAFRFEREG